MHYYDSMSVSIIYFIHIVKLAFYGAESALKYTHSVCFGSLCKGGQPKGHNGDVLFHNMSISSFMLSEVSTEDFNVSFIAVRLSNTESFSHLESLMYLYGTSSC